MTDHEIDVEDVEDVNDAVDFKAAAEGDVESTSKKKSSGKKCSASGGSNPPDNPQLKERCNCDCLKPVECRLETKELWSKFNELGTEMIITKTGRFPLPLSLLPLIRLAVIILVLRWKLSQVVFHAVSQQKNTRGLSFQPITTIRLETKSCRIS